MDDELAATMTMDARQLIEQLCSDLNQAHDEILRRQGCPEREMSSRDWPEWTPQANSIRAAEDMLDKPLSKKSLWLGRIWWLPAIDASKATGTEVQAAAQDEK